MSSKIYTYTPQYCICVNLGFACAEAPDHEIYMCPKKTTIQEYNMALELIYTSTWRDTKEPTSPISVQYHCQKRILHGWNDRSFNGDLLGCSGSGLGYIDGQDAVLQTGLDVVLIDRSREGEDALELADGALAGPEPVSGLGSGILGAFLGLGWWLGVVLAFTAALDNQSLGVGELDIDVLLIDARQFTIEMICLFTLTDVKARRERANRSLVTARAVIIVVIEKTEERGEVARAGEASTEERHVVSWKIGSLKWFCLQDVRLMKGRLDTRGVHEGLI